MKDHAVIKEVDYKRLDGTSTGLIHWRPDDVPVPPGGTTTGRTVTELRHNAINDNASANAAAAAGTPLSPEHKIAMLKFVADYIKIGALKDHIPLTRPHLRIYFSNFLRNRIKSAGPCKTDLNMR
ncbi:uncharacterized protein RAG0_17555 [Rhynchosporium agropyri]|uniref:Uncharacterized protein n=1 Tax=Rhynchosporium agropyri TaxID=914238 RepID=A0A1E1LU37_9HELO|nr:uncharacterized protein RAG0_17555 [Rhynchosporium agropyri]